MSSEIDGLANFSPSGVVFDFSRLAYLKYASCTLQQAAFPKTKMPAPGDVEQAKNFLRPWASAAGADNT